MDDPTLPTERSSQTAPPAGPSPAAPEPEFSDDSGARALADALRSSFLVIRVIMVLLVVVFFCSGLRVVGPQEKAVILRFGLPVGTGPGALLQPGAHWAFPYPIDEIVRIPVGQVQSVASTVGWYATTAAQEAAGTEAPPRPSLSPEQDGYFLTADENIMHVRGTLRYRISEPGLRYALELGPASNLVQNAFNSALLYAAAHYKVDDALTRDIPGFRELVGTRLNRLIADHGLGITADQIELQTIPPRQLVERFAAVLESEINRSRVINDAKSYANQTVSRAKAEADAVKSSGENERKQLVDFVAAEARRFEELRPSFERNPELFRRQHQTEVLRRVLTNAQEKIMLPARGGGKPYELRLQINRTPATVKTHAPPKAEDQH